ncbi:MAG: TonB-dependent receptor, partial [Paludibacter sp.]
MKQFSLSIAFSLLISFSTFAQHSIQSNVFDSKNGQPIEMATIRLLNPADSSLVQGCRADINGNFVLNKINTGNYILSVTSIGYLDYLQKIIVANKDIILKNIQLKENAQLLGEVKVTGTAAQMVVKGDTMEYNATAFKTTQNAVVEDLLKRLPGVEVSSEGKITVNGEEVKKIRVNGKKFFGDDVEMATKNIPAELIDKVQVLEQKSDMAILTGFEDNDTERIINLTFKPNRKKGTFGNVTGGAGMDTNEKFRYDGNMFLNMIDGETQTTITGGGNNVNTSRSTRGRGGYGNNSGITSTQNLGVNNNSMINPNLKIGGDASFNHTYNETVTNSNRESYLKGSRYNNNDSTVANSENYSANMRLEVEWKLDSVNTLVFQPTIGYNRSFSDSEKKYTYLTDGKDTSWGNTNNSGNGTSIDAGLNLIYSHKFMSKKGRTFTSNLQTGISQSDNISFNFSDKHTTLKDTVVDQRTTNHSDKYNVSLRMSFVEPLWNLKNYLETSISLKNTNNEAEKLQYNRDINNNNDYTKKDSVYSNNFTNKFYSETLELNYRYVSKDYNIMLGMKGEPSQTYSYRLYGNQTERYTPNEVVNFAPTGRLQYNFGKKKFARLDYRGQTDQPSINQMQPVKNNSNLMNETVGNPTLNPAFTHRLRMMFTTFNDSTFSSFSTFLSAQATKDALISNSIYDFTGKQYNQTVNGNAAAIPISINGNVMFNIPLIQKRLHFSTSTSGGFDKRYGYSAKGLDSINTANLILGDLSSTRSYSAGEQISLTYTQDVFEIGTKCGVRYTNTLNNLNPNLAITTDWSAAGNVVLHLPYKFNISTDLNYTTRKGYTNFDQNQLLWNATMDKTVLNGKGVVSLKLNDILRQQLNIRQTIGDNYIQYSSYNTLTSYFLLSFTYKINKFKGAKNNPAETNPFERFGPGNHTPRGDGGGRGGDHGGY